MLRESLIYLNSKDYQVHGLKKTIENLLLTMDEDQLLHLLMEGVKISTDINLYFYPGAGFRCTNDHAEIYGNYPICGNIERALNKNLVNS